MIVFVSQRQTTFYENIKKQVLNCSLSCQIKATYCTFLPKTKLHVCVKTHLLKWSVSLWMQSIEWKCSNYAESSHLKQHNATSSKHSITELEDIQVDLVYLGVRTQSKMHCSTFLDCMTLLAIILLLTCNWQINSLWANIIKSTCA